MGIKKRSTTPHHYCPDEMMAVSFRASKKLFPPLAWWSVVAFLFFVVQCCVLNDAPFSGVACASETTTTTKIETTVEGNSPKTDDDDDDGAKFPSIEAVAAFVVEEADETKEGEEETPGTKQHTKPYGNPRTGSCLPNEMKVQIQGIEGTFCSPKCGSNAPCPADPYKWATAKGQCVLQVPSSPTPSQCALICRPEPGTNGGCPKHGECQPIQGLGICTYPPFSSSSESVAEKEEEET